MALLNPKRAIPRCDRCGSEHYNFQKCSGVRPIQVFRPREGFREGFTHRTQGSVVVADRVVGRPRKPLHSETA